MSRCYNERNYYGYNKNCGCSHCNPTPYSNCCCIGVPGADGKSAYQIAVDNGFVGSETEWLESLKGESGPFLSSYIEAVGSSQDVRSRENFVFDTDPDIIDVVGSAISIDSTGKIFTINKAGLYRVEWSMNLLSGGNPVLVGILENNLPTSALSNNAMIGNYSSGALISVEEGDLPFRLTLHNFGAELAIANPIAIANTAISMRITRFADGPDN